MTTEMASVAQITTKALAILSKELGPVNTARFINQFSVGSVVSRQSSVVSRQQLLKTANCQLTTLLPLPTANCQLTTANSGVAAPANCGVAAPQLGIQESTGGSV